MQRSRMLLIVDDEEMIVRSTRMLLDFDAIPSEMASRPEDAFEVAGRCRPDVILQDVRMPGLDLATHLARLRTDPRTRDAAVILFSASIDLREIASDESLPHDGLLEKPFTMDLLRAAIDAARERHSERQPAPNA